MGKVIMPGNQIEEFLERIEDAEDEIEPFRKYLNEISKEFEEYLTDNFSAKTARKHCYKIDLFIDFLCFNTDVKCIE